MARRKRGHNEGTVYPIAGGKWRAAITLPTLTRAGNPKKMTETWDTKREAEAARRRMVRERDEGLLPTNGQATVARLFKDWLAVYVQNGSLRKNTVSTYTYLVSKHILPHLGKARLRDLDTRRLDLFFEDLRTQGGLGQGTVRMVRALLREAFDAAETWGMVGRNVVAKTRAPRRSEPAAKVFTPAGARQIIAACRAEPIGRVPILMVGTGLRIGEALGLRWENVNEETGELIIREQLQYVIGVGFELSPLKTKKSERRLVVPEPLLPVLREQKEEQKDAGSEGDFDLVFTRVRDGGPLSDKTVRKAYYRMLDNAGVPRVKLHDLRHCFTALMSERGTSPRVMADLLGHSHVGMTLNVYDHAQPGAARTVARAIGDQLGGQGE